MDPRDELRALLSIAGVTTALVGRKAGITQQAVSAMQTGRLRVTQGVLRAARVAACEALREAVGSGLTVLGRSMENGDHSDEVLPR